MNDQRYYNSIWPSTFKCLLASSALFLLITSTVNLDAISAQSTQLDGLTSRDEPRNSLKQRRNKYQEQAFGVFFNSRQFELLPDAATAQEWVERFACKRGLDHPNANRSAYLSSFRVPLSNIGYHLMDECNRDQHAWRFRYIDELQPPFTLQVKDRSIDERLANIMYTLNMNNMFDMSYFAFNSGDPREDELNELRVAGSRVNEAQCSLELAQMVNVFDDMQRLLAEFRSSSDPHSHNMTLQERHIRMARVLDSFGRYESGALEGRLRLVGNYEQCIGSQLTGAEWDQTEGQRGAKIQMRYCWANLNFDKHLQPMLRRRQRLPHETGVALLNMGVCLPQSCHSKSFHSTANREIVQRLVDSQLRLPDSIYIERTFELESVFCLVDADSEWGRLPASGKLCLVFVCSWAVLCIGVTMMNVHKSDGATSNNLKNQDTVALQKHDQQQLRLSGGTTTVLARYAQYLDLGSSWREFTSDRRPLDASAPIDLDVLNPIKFGICVFLVVPFHVKFMYLQNSTSPVSIWAYVDSSIMLQADLMNSVWVDTFFVITGILLTYTRLKKFSLRIHRQNPLVPWRETSLTGNSYGQVKRRPGSSKSNNNSTQRLDLRTGANLCERNLPKIQTFLSQWLESASSRYFRLVPLYALMFWIRRDVLPYLGSGPLWDHGLNRNTANGACSQEPWYMPFTFLAAFVPLSRQCFTPTWSIAHDILASLLLPPVTLGFFHRPKMTIVGIIVFSVMSLVSTVDAIAYAHPANIWELLDAKLQGLALLFNDLSRIYTCPFYRAPALLIGSLSGYFLFKYQQEHAHCSRSDDPRQDTNLGLMSTPECDSISKINRRQTANSKLLTTNTKRTQKKFKGWPAWFTGPALRFAYFYLGLHFFISIFANDLEHILNPLRQVIGCYWLTADRIVWSITNSIVFLRIVTDWRHGPLMQEFARQRWRTLAKLNFPMIFVHWMFLVTSLGSATTMPIFSQWQILAGSSFVVLCSLPITVLVYVMFENPMDRMIRRELFRF